MSGHQDRLAGLVVLSAAATGIPTVVVRGVCPASLAWAVGTAAELADAPAPAGGAVVAAHDAADAAAQLDALHLAASAGGPGLVWVLWDSRFHGPGLGHFHGPGGGRGHALVHRAAARAGLETVASYRFVGRSASPTHLVREGPGHALRWFATSVRPRWGARSRLARLGNYLPRVGHHFLAGRAVLFRAVSGQPPTWPGVDGGSAGATSGPAVLHLGGGATAGRLVLTWADGSGAPTHHTKLAPEHLAREVVAEAEALTVLADIPAVAGTVPTLLGLRHGPSWAALTASHLPGRPPRVTTVSRALRRAVPMATARPAEVDTVVTAWLAALSQASQDRALAVASRGARAARLGAAVASLADPALRSAVRQGLDLGSSSTGLLHGDFWPGNVHRVKALDGATRIAVLDWESAFVGHPLVDLLTWLVNRAGGGDRVRDKALEALGAPRSNRKSTVTARCVGSLLATSGQPLEPAEVEALVLAQLVVIATHGGPVGGDRTHERAWLDAVNAVWADWQRTGASPWTLVGRSR
jgi:hypothetical protein